MSHEMGGYLVPSEYADLLLDELQRDRRPWWKRVLASVLGRVGCRPLWLTRGSGVVIVKAGEA